MAEAAEGLNDDVAALAYYQAASVSAVGSRDWWAFVEIEIRETARALRGAGFDAQEAIASLGSARHVARSRGAGSSSASAAMRIAELYRELGDRAMALKELESGLSDLGDQDTVFGHFLRVSRAQLLTEDAARWHEGISELRLLLAGVERRLNHARLDVRRGEIIGEMVRVYEAIVRAAALAHAPAHLDDGRQTTEFACDLHESAKSRSMLSALAKAPLPAPDTVPDDLRERETRLLQQERSLQAGSAGGSEASRLDQLANVQSQLEACWRDMRASAPSYVRFRSGEPCSFDEVSGWLDRQPDPVGLLSLFCDAEGTTAFVARRGQVRPAMFRMAIGQEELKSAARQLRRTFNGNPREFPPYPPIRGDAPHRRRLDCLSAASQAFAPVWDALDGVDVVCIAPHGPLHLLPLHALSSDGRFAAERFAVVYTPSLSALLQLESRARPARQSTRALVVGVSSADDGHPELFEDEADLFADTGWPVTHSLGVAGASKTRVTRQLRDHSIVHVSCHGYFDERTPLGSGLVLSNKTSKAPRDLSKLAMPHRQPYLLTAEELMRSGFAPDLVTLSACSAGLQQVRNRGDELEGFSRALLLAGARTAVLGMWNLDQVSSREFFRSFYRHLSADGQRMPKWRALSAAQREMLASSRGAWRHPYHWAPSYLIGDWGSL